MEPKYIDIEAVVRSKFPKQAAKVPGFIFKFAAWLICQRQMNDIIRELRDCEGEQFAEGMCRILNVSYNIQGEDNIPADGRFIFVSNHPLGAFDGISYINVFGKKYPGKFRVIVNDLLMYIHGLRPVFLPVNTLGRQKREDMEAIQQAYDSPDIQLMSFPAGFCSRFIGGRIQDVEWKKSVITQAIESKRDIIPMYFSGRNSITFYGVEWLRRVFGMKFNIGLVLLPWQMVKTARNKTFGITIGKPIPWQTFTDKQKSATEWAQWLRDECYKMKN
ncbi:MAG: 1-acyl-sn-glycerol-3-phosphate acyltransferase [Bacteroidales bacterium]|nr:1-acyl-sn-glycerol-3-phosphate acyltransferase [Candidatus Liminaster caballi]